MVKLVVDLCLLTERAEAHLLNRTSSIFFNIVTAAPPFEIKLGGGGYDKDC